ncbi:MAG: hypothetical protein ACFCUM_02335 [Bacteroidales bacterium]
MAFLQGIRKKIGYFILKRKLPGLLRKKQFINLADAGTIGIIFHQTDDKSFMAVQDFLKSLASEGKQIAAVGYIESRKIPDFYTLRKGFNFFCIDDLNWFFQPEPAFINDFIEREFDILINLSIENRFPVEYIYALSKAKFKTGKFRNGSTHADLAIDIKDNRDVNYLIQHINHYLRMINKKQ